MFLYTFYRKYLWLLKIIAFFFMGLIAALVIALSRIDLESLRGNILSVLRDATNMPIEIDGKMSWKFSLRPEIELNNVRVPNADWAKNKNLFSANKIDIRLDLISLFKSKPAIRNIKIHDAKIALEKNKNGDSSVVVLKNEKTPTPENTTYTEKVNIAKYPVAPLPFGGMEIDKLSANIYGDVYDLRSLGFHNDLRNDNLEFVGWVKPYDNNIPFVIKFSEYNSERKIYPVQIAFATGEQALIADIALEGTSKMPIDFIVRGDIPNIQKSGHWFNIDILKLPKISLNISGGVDNKKISLRKSTVSIGNSSISFSGVYDWSKKQEPFINAKITSDNIDLYTSFPEWYGAGRQWIHPNRDLNVFHDIPLFGKFLYNTDLNLNINLKRFVVYRSLDLSDLNVKVNAKNHHVRADVKTEIASGDVNVIIDANIDENGVYTAESAAHGKHIYVGEILNEVWVKNIISGLPVNLDFYVVAHGKDLSEIMQTITGPVLVHSVDKGYAHADLVEYMYGGDFLTSLRHNVEDMFTGKKRDMIEITSAIANLKLRDGLIETQNGVAVETHVINLRLAGSLDLGKENIQLSLATVPVRGLKLSLSGNFVNALQISGNLAEPDIKISSAAIAGKVGSAVGLGLLLAPLTGGLSIAGGFVAGLLAGDLLESWLADEHPYETAMKKGAPLQTKDPDWMNQPIDDLARRLFNN